MSPNMRKPRTASSKEAKGRGSDAVSLDRNTVDQVSELTTQIVQSKDIRRQKVEELKRDYEEGRLRQRAIFEATAAAILKGESALEEIDVDDLL